MKYSIKTQLALSFASLIAVILGLNLLMNNLLLEKFYILQKQTDMIEIYNEINQIEDWADYQSDEFEENFRSVSDANNVELNILWVDREGNGLIIYQSRDNVVMRGRIEGYFRGFQGFGEDSQDVLTKTDNYIIRKFRDSADATDYLEAWGKLQSGCYFLMRIPIQSIRENVKISNQFTQYIILAGILLSTFFVWWISKKITAPIQELTALSRRMANLEFDAKYTSGGKNEIGELGRNFNQMSETLERTIAELKTANNELKRDIEQKTQIDEMRKEFLSNVSHELKTPIALIQGYAEGLKECINDDAQSRDFYCDVIMDESAKMNTMVKKLLTLNQLEFGNDVVDMKRFNLTELLCGTVQSAGILAAQKNVTIHFEETEPLYVWGDEFKIEEVVMNYVSNALNHVYENGHIDVTVERTGDKVRVSVFNTGAPIPENDLDKVWIKFYKVDKARTREYGGSGIGLSIVKAIMESMHQECGVYNCKDGVCFWFELDGSSKGE
ncbi:MAG: HAMP domain-containing sensor histidine kinase [Eubacteriales bacterium]|nr:HAMP domain-containing sensor histidine kinase [Eubacteriales bacterium]